MQMSVACYVERKKRADALLLAVLFQGWEFNFWFWLFLGSQGRCVESYLCEICTHSTRQISTWEGGKPVVYVARMMNVVTEATETGLLGTRCEAMTGSMAGFCQ